MLREIARSLHLKPRFARRLLGEPIAKISQPRGDADLWDLAEIAEKYLQKGRSVFIEGRLQLDSWDDKQTGQKRSRLRVVAESLQLLGSREGESASSGPGPSGSPRRAASRSM